MKNKIVLTAAFFAASTFSFAEIALTENLSVGGFVDMSYTHADDDQNTDSDSGNSYQVDQVEITFGLDYGVVTAQIDLQWELDDGSSIDQAFTTYDLGNGFAVTAGNYDSMLGFEAFEAPGLYQYSTAYSSNTEAFEDDLTISDAITPGTNNGVKVTYEDGTQFFGVSLQDGGIFGDNRLGGDSDGTASAILANLTNFDALAPGLDVDVNGNSIIENNIETSGYAIEAAYARDLGNGFNVFVGILMEETEVEEQLNLTTGDLNTELSVDTTVLNGYVTYETGAWLFAAEMIQTEHDVEGDQADIEIDSFLLMANYTYSDQASVTARISNVDVEDIFDATKLTVAHLYAFTDNLALALEVSSVDYDYEANTVEDGDTLEGAVELLFTF
jgi:hypothetical protein